MKQLMNKPFRIVFFVVLVSLLILLITDDSEILGTKRESPSEEKMMRSIFGNYDSELKLSLVDSSTHTDGIKHSLSIPGAILYHQYFMNADSSECVLLTASPSYKSSQQYKKDSGDTKGKWLDSEQNLMKQKYDLISSDCHACAVAMGYYVFHNVSGKWHLTKSYPKFDRMGGWGKAPTEIQLRKIGKDRSALFVETRGGSQGENIRRLSIYGLVDNSMQEVFNVQTYYSNDGAVGKPEKILSQKELKLLDEYDREMYHRSLDYIEEKSRYELIDRSGDYFDLKLTKQQTNYRGEISKEITHYVFKAGTYEIQTQSDKNIQEIQANFINKH